MKLEKKILSKYFEMILSGDKKYELRLDNFNINEGDILVFREWDKEKQDYTGRNIEKEATNILKTKEINFWKKEDIEKYGYQIISFK